MEGTAERLLERRQRLILESAAWPIFPSIISFYFQAKKKPDAFFRVMHSKDILILTATDKSTRLERRKSPGIPL
jgi:hypothetical protein